MNKSKIKLLPLMLIFSYNKYTNFTSLHACVLNVRHLT